MNTINYLELVMIQVRNVEDASAFLTSPSSMSLDEWRERYHKESKILEKLWLAWQSALYEGIDVSTDEFHLSPSVHLTLERTLTDLFNSQRWQSCGLNADWACEAWCFTWAHRKANHFSGDWYVLCNEDGTYSVAQYYPDREEQCTEHIRESATGEVMNFPNIISAKRFAEKQYNIKEQ